MQKATDTYLLRDEMATAKEYLHLCVLEGCRPPTFGDTKIT